MRISDWSSDVCSSDLFKEVRIGGMEINSNADDNVTVNFAVLGRAREFLPTSGSPFFSGPAAQTTADVCGAVGEIGRASCRERVVSVRVDLGGRRIIKKKKQKAHKHIHMIKFGI